MPSLVLISPAVRSAIGNRQTDRHIALYYVDYIPTKQVHMYYTYRKGVHYSWKSRPPVITLAYTMLYQSWHAKFCNVSPGGDTTGN